MKKSRKPGFPAAIRFGLLELLLVLLGLIFVRKEVYLAGAFGTMILHWQEYALLVLMFVDGLFRGYGQLQARTAYDSPLRNKYLRILLPVTLFLFVSTSSLCDKLNALCIHEEWWRDLGVALLAAGVVLSGYAQMNRPKGLETDTPLPEGNKFVVPADGKAEVPAESEAEAPAEGEAKAKEPAQLEESSKEIASTKGGSVTGDTNSSASQASPAEQPIQKDKESSNTPTADEGEIEASGPWKILRYPGRAALLLELIGISLTLSAWLPLITIPGLIVMFKWELADVEAFRIKQFGEKYLRYKQKSWLLIPYIY